MDGVVDEEEQAEEEEAVRSSNSDRMQGRELLVRHNSSSSSNREGREGKVRTGTAAAAFSGWSGADTGDSHALLKLRHPAQLSRRPLRAPTGCQPQQQTSQVPFSSMSHSL